MKGVTGLRRITNAFGYSLDGIRAAFRDEAAFRQELALAAVLIPCAFLVDVSPLARALMIACVFLVLVVELLNSAIEAVVDRIGEERHDLSKKAKDVGSAAVFFCLANLGVVWAICLFGRA
jgi:diacylglycerol kinase (ATP)